MTDGVLNENTKRSSDEMTFSRLAVSLARDYANIYHVNMEDGHYTEYACGEDDKLKVLSEGDDFFTYSKDFCNSHVFADDREKFLSVVNKVSLQNFMRERRSFMLNYRLMVKDIPIHYHLKATCLHDENGEFIIIGVREVDTDMRHEFQMASEPEIYAQIAHAMLNRYEVIYYVDIVTDEYIEYSSSEKYATLNIGVKSTNFFEDTLENIQTNIHPDDIPLLQAEMQKGKLLFELTKDSTYSINYRLILDGVPEYVNLRAVRPKNDNRHIIIGVTNINDAMTRELEYKEAMTLAVKDPLTGVKNKRAYLETEQSLDAQIAAKEEPSFAIVVFDINDLKHVNDEEGHLAGDSYIKDSCSLICDAFKHSPVFRIGGDEFVAILQGADYNDYIKVFENFRKTIQKNHDSGGIVIASGLAVFDAQIDLSVSDVFKRADRIMYKNKSTLKLH